MKIHIIAAIATLATAACQQDLDRDEPTQGADLPTSEVRDSAGILITENARPADGSRLGWRIGPEPTVTIGAVEGEDPYLFQWVRSAFRISDGRIVVANGGTEEIRVFTATGTHLLSWGGRGQGPGDFGSLSMAGPWPGDSIVAWHSGNYGVSFFDDSGRFGHSFGLRGGPNQPWRRRPVVVRPGGTIVTVRAARDRGTRLVEILDGEGGLHGSVGRQPNIEKIIARGPGGHTESVPAAYSRELVTAAWGDLVIASPNKPYEIRAFRADGTLARIVQTQTCPGGSDRSRSAGLSRTAKGPVPHRCRCEHRSAHIRGLPGRNNMALPGVLYPRRAFPGVLDSHGRRCGPPLGPRVRPSTGGEPGARSGPSSIWRGVCWGLSRRRRAWTSCRSARTSSWGRAKDEFEVEYVQVWPLER